MILIIFDAMGEARQILMGQPTAEELAHAQTLIGVGAADETDDCGRTAQTDGASLGGPTMTHRPGIGAVVAMVAAAAVEHRLWQRRKKWER
jgi:hypothetical protein